MSLGLFGISLIDSGMTCVLSRHLSELVEGAVVLLDVVLSEPLDGFAVVHPLERPLRGFEVLEKSNQTSTW